MILGSGSRLRIALAVLRALACAALLAALMSGCGSSEDAFEVYYQAPSWSPEGTSIAFVASGDLYVTKLGGETTRRSNLDSQQKGAGDPVWSPDGAKIAYDVFERGESYSFTTRTVVLNVGSGRIVTVSRDPQPFGSCHVWSPDGRRLALLTAGGRTRTDLSVVNADGSGVERVVKVGDLETSCPAWSPDGRSLAYVCCGTADDVYVVEADGRRKRRLTQGMYASDVTWSPDGELIAFHHFGDGDNDGYLSMRPDGAAPRSIAPDESGVATGLVWSPDSRRIAYVRDGNNELFVADRDGSNRHLFTRGVCCPRWSPRGNQLAFVKDDSDGHATIYVVGADGRRLVKASSPPETNDN